ncbi:MAG: gamma-glutamyl-gamma-aminobutyrate hydrolase family protein [Solirubrobacterales bacterium]
MRAISAPIIGVSSSEIRIPEHLKQIPKGEPPHREICLGLPYLNAVVQVDAVPLIIAPLQQDIIERVLDTVDGICLSGGPDLDPKTYGQPPHAMLGPTEYATDSFEIALAKAADARGMPILAICRGAQVINVARGGTLFQHIPDSFGAAIEHRQKELGHTATHEVTVSPESLLSATLGNAGSAWVNSFHHQSVEKLGTNLRATAESADGIIEGIEAVDRDFVLGVQWHAESLTDTPLHEALFRGLADAALRYREQTDTRSVRAV